ncbi:hypothetical protein [Anaplasma phagocytophilum]|uniref:hypothetical protein n=1 Tax=Anaplasma phagocytophilum TaxID=948 RepID=UPI0018C86AA9|nr:hypothetical protein [Anaplasma phagocytophilum]
MMLLLGRLISFLLLLPRPPVKTSFSLVRRWISLALVLVRRFVRRRRMVVTRASMGCMLLPRRKMEQEMKLQFVGERAAVAEAVVPRHSI